jgi:hypothetical protein
MQPYLPRAPPSECTKTNCPLMLASVCFWPLALFSRSSSQQSNILLRHNNKKVWSWRNLMHSPAAFMHATSLYEETILQVLLAAN